MHTQIVEKDSPVEAEVKNLYVSAFPQSESPPIETLLEDAEKENIDLLAFFDDSLFVGFAYLLRAPSLVYILYLAVEQKIRSKGYGAQMLQQIETRFSGCRQALDIEAVDETADNNLQRRKRRDFYCNNGFSTSGLEIRGEDSLYEILVKNGTCSAEELAAVLGLSEDLIGCIESAGGV